MKTRSLATRLAPLGFTLTSLIACAASPADEKTQESSEAQIIAVPCPGCIAPITPTPLSIDLGQIGILSDAHAGVRTSAVQLTVPRTGTLSATFANSFGGQWVVTGFRWPARGVTVQGPGPVQVTAGDEVIVYLELSPDLEGVGLLNTSLALRVTPPPFSIFGASGTVALKATTAWFYNAGPGLYVSLDITCANIGSDNAVQLGEASSPCGQGGAQDNNDLRFNVNVTNLGAQTGTFTIDLPGAPFGQLCNVGPNLPVAPGQTLSVPCEASALANATHGFNADLGATYPLTVVTSNHTYTFGFPVDIQPSPVSSPPSGGGSSSGGGGGSGGGGTVPCSIAPDGVCTGAGCLTCVYNAGDGCVTLGGSFCSYYDAQQTVQGYGVCCWTTSEPATDTCGASAACDQDGSGQ